MSDKDFREVERTDCSFNFVNNVFNMVQTPGPKVGLKVIGQFLNESLSNGKKAALVTFDNPTLTISAFKTLGFDFEQALETEQLIYFYYKTNFAETLSLSQDYQSIFDEIAILGGENIERVAFTNADLLLNTQSPILTSMSIQKMAAASGNHKFTFLGQYNESQSSTFETIQEKCKSVLASFYTIKNSVDGAVVTDHSMRSYGFGREAVFQLGRGYVRA
ncbi:MAG: hypothetical protein EP326_07805 [Deltaproteobacteria bacterium]|nr:MAG: hypothetical protein EP326_07805 [Deltaproteobacteria bacterium]TNF24954.1 MAG: hypothetical protein EP319_17350 [Deltaproteobacteria bacterium]